MRTDAYCTSYRWLAREHAAALRCSTVPRVTCINPISESRMRRIRCIVAFREASANARHWKAVGFCFERAKRGFAHSLELTRRVQWLRAQGACRNFADVMDFVRMRAWRALPALQPILHERVCALFSQIHRLGFQDDACVVRMRLERKQMRAMFERTWRIRMMNGRGTKCSKVVLMLTIIRDIDVNSLQAHRVTIFVDRCVKICTNAVTGKFPFQVHIF